MVQATDSHIILYLNKVPLKRIERTLEQQRVEFANRSFLATPLAGLIAWTVTGIAALILPIYMLYGHFYSH